MAVTEIARKSPFDSSFNSDEPRRNLKWEFVGVIIFCFAAFYTRFKLEGDSQQFLTIVLGLVFVFLVFQNIVYGILAFIVAIGLSPDSVIYPNVRLEDYMLPPLLLIWFVQHNSRRHELVSTEVFSPIRIYMLIVTISTLKGILMNTIWSMSLTIPFYFKYVEYFIIFWFIMNNVKSKEDFFLVIYTSLVVCAIVAYIAYTNRASYIEETQKVFVRATGPEGETPNILGGYYMFHMMIAFSFIFAIKNYAYKGILVAFLLIVAMPLLYTYSRTSFASLLIGLIVTSMFLDLRFFIFLGVLAIFFPIILPVDALPEDIVQRYATILDIFDSDSDQPSSWTARTTGWYVYTVGTWNNYPLLGKGMGSIGLGIDSAYVKKFIESGILGLLTFFMILIRLMRVGLDVIKSAKNDPVYRAYGVGYMGGFAAMIIHSIGVSSFSTIRTAEPFWLFSGILVAVHYQLKKRNELEEEEQSDREELSFIRPKVRMT